MATNIFDTSKNTINVTSVTDENVYGFDDVKNKVDVTGNLITEIVPVAGQTYWVDGIECVCFYSNPASGDKLRVYSKNGQIHIVEAVKVSSGSVFKFIDKNHDLSYYTCGKDYVDETLPIYNYVFYYTEETGARATNGGYCYGYISPYYYDEFLFTKKDNAKEATDALIERINSNNYVRTINDLSIVLDAFRKSHSNVWCLPYDSDFDFVNYSWLSNVSSTNLYVTSNFRIYYTMTGIYVEFYGYDLSQATSTRIQLGGFGYYLSAMGLSKYTVRLSAEF